MTVATPDIPQVESAIVEMTNAFRKEKKLGPVKPDAELARAARAYAEFLANSPIFSHTADGRQPGDRAQAAGYAYCQIAENLAMNRDSRGFASRQLAREAVEGWKNSAGHRENMLAPSVTDIGVGVAKAKAQQKYLSVQLLGRPESLKYGFGVQNQSPAVVMYRHGSDMHEINPRYTVRHTVCYPGEITFMKAILSGNTKSIGGRYQTRDGDLFVLKPGAAGSGIEVEVKTGPRASR
jgi:hypothetical protein